MEINGKNVLDYNDFNVKEAIILIDKFAPDFGGTNIFDPINSAYSLDAGVKNKRIFLLTDGMVDKPQEVINRVQSISRD